METGDIFTRVAFGKYLRSVLTNEPSECTFLEDCQQHFLGIDYNGDVFPCACFPSEFEEFCYGNIKIDTMDQILRHPMRISLATRFKRIDECNECDYTKICNGGCPLNSYLNGNIDNSDPNCDQYKRIFSYIKTRISEEAGLKKLKS